MDPVREFVGTLLSASMSLANAPATITATASYQFSPSMSQAEACKRAEERAKVNALYSKLGQEVHASTTSVCQDNGQYSCQSMISNYESTRGVIQSFKRTKESVSGWTCTVSVEVKATEVKPTQQTWLQATAKLDRGIYQSNDVAKLAVSTNDKGFVTVFSYNPTTDDVTLIYPSEAPNIPRWTYRGQPLTVNIPMEPYDGAGPQLFFVSVSTGPLMALDSYKLHNFYKMWDNHPIKDKVLVRTSFNVRSKP